MAEKLQRHHLLWSRKLWISDRIGKLLRNDRFMSIYLPSDIHSDLHANTSPVPLPSHYMLRAINADFYSTPDAMQTVERFINAVHEVSQNPRFPRIEREVGVLTIQAIEEQIPYFEEAGYIGEDVA